MLGVMGQIFGVSCQMLGVHCQMLVVRVHVVSFGSDIGSWLPMLVVTACAGCFRSDVWELTVKYSELGIRYWITGVGDSQLSDVP